MSSANDLGRHKVSPAVSCTGKVAFDSHRLATGVTKRRGRNDVKRSAYHCAHCGKWHVGADQYGMSRRASLAYQKAKEGAID